MMSLPTRLAPGRLVLQRWPTDLCVRMMMFRMCADRHGSH